LAEKERFGYQARAKGNVREEGLAKTYTGKALQEGYKRFFVSVSNDLY
jgi:hypothetical protein